MDRPSISLACSAFTPNGRVFVSDTGTRLNLTCDGGLRALEEEREPVRRQQVDGARLELRAVQLRPGAAEVVTLDDDGRRRGGPRVQPQRDARDQAEPPAR